MKKTTYQVNRDQIYVGQVINNIDLSCYDKNPCLNLKNGELVLFPYVMATYRSMLFVPTKDGLAQDLLYDSPNYPIVDISRNISCQYSQFLIHDTYNLSHILKFYNYPEVLDERDIVKIRKRFFDGKFTRTKAGMFLPHSSFKTMQNLSDLSWKEVISSNFTLKKNAFIPAIEEGKIKKLVRI